MVGLDFAPRVIQRLHRLLPEADFRVGDIGRMPFEDGEVHVYYSGGVVEHDESGPAPALREARRVLAPDGWFLCSVPDASALRNLLFRKDRTERLDMSPELVVKRTSETRPEPPPEAMRFFQYAFTQEEFTQLLENAGFEVTAHFGYALIWGLMEIPGVHRLSSAVRRRRVERPAVASPGAADDASRERRGSTGILKAGKQLLRRALVREDPTTPILGTAIGWANEHMANMRMYVARPVRSQA